jgi:hypothetical protein
MKRKTKHRRQPEPDHKMHVEIMAAVNSYIDSVNADVAAHQTCPLEIPPQTK